MAGIIYPAQHVMKPPGASVDWANPINGRLVERWLMQHSGHGAVGIARGIPTTANGNATTVTGPRGPVLSLDGAGDYLSVADRDLLDITGNWTIALRFLFTSGSYNVSPPRGLIGKGTGINIENTPYCLYFEWNTLGLRYMNSWTAYEQTYSISGLSQNAWHHVVGTHTARVLRIYVDGALVATSSTLAADPPANANAVTIGSLGAQDYLTGYIDDVGVWARALEASDSSTPTPWRASCREALSVGRGSRRRDHQSRVRGGDAHHGRRAGPPGR
jgi:hypothetical protein